MTTLGPWEACGNLIRTKREADGSGGFLVAEVPANTGNTSEKAALMAAAPELYRTVTLQHQIIDKLLAMLIERDPNFYPTKSAVWPLLAEADAPRVLAKATGSQQ